MKVLATRKVLYQGTWYKAGENFECREGDFDGLAAAGVEAYKEKKAEKKDRAIMMEIKKITKFFFLFSCCEDSHFV